MVVIGVIKEGGNQELVPGSHMCSHMLQCMCTVYCMYRNLETHLPVIPPEVEEVRFRWSAGDRKYKYNFYRYI